MSVRDFVTLRIGGQLWGVEAVTVHDVFRPHGITPVPLAEPEIAGVLNLRGRIVTAICGRSLLGLDPAAGEGDPIAIGLEINGDKYGLIVDGVEEPLEIETDDLLPAPSGLPPRWAAIVDGVHRLDGELLVILNTRRLLDGAHPAAA